MVVNFPTLALRLYDEAIKKQPDDETIQRDAAKIYRKNAFYKIIGNQTSKITSVAFSPNDSQILTGTEDNTARLWELKGNLIKEFTGHTSYISSVAFSPDGRRILTGSSDNTGRLWDLKGNLIQLFTAYKNSLAFSPDGSQILIGSFEKKVQLWWSVPTLEDYLKSGKMKELTPKQKEQYGIN